MKRRIALAIFATVWAVLVIGGAGVYLTTRTILVADLDATLLARAAALPELAEGDLPPAPEGDRYVVLNELGQTVARTPPGPTGGATWRINRAAFARLADGTRVRSLTIQVSRPGEAGHSSPEPLTVVYSGSSESVDRVLSRLIAWLIGLGLVSSLAAAALAVRVADTTLRPLQASAEVMARIDEHQLDRRIPVQDLPPELAPVAERLNDMLARLEESFARQRRFMADASHELRTPVAALLTTLEVGLRRPRDVAALEGYLRACLADARMLHALTVALLAHVKGDVGNSAQDDPVADIDILELLESFALVADGLALAKDVRIRRHLPPAGTRFRTRPETFRSIVLNLLANAVEYNRHGGSVDLTCEVRSDGLQLAVRDTGIGIASEDLTRVFEPFLRVDPARGREGGHLGLGLSLVRAAVERLGGSITVSSEIGSGTTFAVWLPPEPPKSLGGERREAPATKIGVGFSSSSHEGAV